YTLTSPARRSQRHRSSSNVSAHVALFPPSPTRRSTLQSSLSAPVSRAHSTLTLALALARALALAPALALARRRGLDLARTGVRTAKARTRIVQPFQWLRRRRPPSPHKLPPVSRLGCSRLALLGRARCRAMPARRRRRLGHRRRLRAGDRLLVSVDTPSEEPSKERTRRTVRFAGSVSFSTSSFSWPSSSPFLPSRLTFSNPFPSAAWSITASPSSMSVSSPSSPPRSTIVESPSSSSPAPPLLIMTLYVFSKNAFPSGVTVYDIVSCARSERRADSASCRQ
ncbi:hypothetical protein DMC30DRAFT_17324, partial [Rhodotorula diobovata]